MPTDKSDHDCVQVAKIATLDANQSNLGRSMDELRSELKENTSAVSTLNKTLAGTVEVVNGLAAGQRRTLDWTDKIFFAVLSLVMTLGVAVIVLQFK